MEINSLREPVRPWLTIWTKPRETIRNIVDFDSDYGVIFVPLIALVFVCGQL